MRERRGEKYRRENRGEEYRRGVYEREGEGLVDYPHLHFREDHRDVPGAVLKLHLVNDFHSAAVTSNQC